MPVYIAPPSRAVPGALTAGLVASAFAVPVLLVGSLPHHTVALMVVVLIAGHGLAWRGATQLMMQRLVHDRATAATARRGFAIAGLSAATMGAVHLVEPAIESIFMLMFVERIATIVAWLALARLLCDGHRAAAPITIGHLLLTVTALIVAPIAAISSCSCHPPAPRPMIAIVVGLLGAAVTLGLVQLAQWRATPAPRGRHLDALAALVDLVALAALAGVPRAIAAWAGPPTRALAIAILSPFALTMLLVVVADQLRRAARRAALPVAIVLKGNR
jgi:hypothetical protein